MLHRLKDERGFTLIELLVVVLIIGILAAVALPTFLGQRDKGFDSDAKSNARNIQTLVESCGVDNSQNYAQCVTAAQLGDTSIAIGANPGQVQIQGAQDTYTITARSKARTNNVNKAFIITKTATGVTKSATPAGTVW